MMNRNRLSLYLALVLALAVPPAFAQSGQTISLTVDASQAPLKIVRTHMALAVKPGPITLYYPKWIPGEHGPDGPISNVTGLKFTANDKVVPWLRDTLDVFTFHVNVPADATQLDVTFDYIEPNGSGFATASSSATDKLVVISWNQNVMYPAGPAAQQLIYKTKLILPPGWKFGSALATENSSGNEINFKPVSLDRLVDSPVIAGQYYRSLDLTPPGEPIHHEIDMVADSEIALNMSADVQKKMTNLVAESGKLFGARHYGEYHFLLTLSDHVAHFGLEHHESNDSRLPERALIERDAALTLGGLLAHEFAHSWSGKYRRPADLAVAYYQAPMETDLLWGYEGFTEYAGPLLAVRSGLWTPDVYRENLATIAASLGPGRPGRTWRPLIDTTIGEPGIRGGGGWGNWRRGTDYYDEGDLLWLEVAAILHRESKGQKSIDDFAHAFFGGQNNGAEVKPYTLDDFVRTLNALAPYDWKEFFHERLTSTSADAPVGGIEGGGWKVVFTNEPLRLFGRRNNAGDIYSIGLQLSANGDVSDSIYGSVAFNAGITSGMKVVGVNGRVYSHDILEDAIAATRESAEVITLLVVDNDYYKTCTINYRGGLRYPHLVRDESKPDYLADLIKPRSMN